MADSVKECEGDLQGESREAMATSNSFLLVLLVFSSCMSTLMARNSVFGVWNHAFATFYGNMQGDETQAGACAYRNVFDMGYGLQTAALSTALFHDGATCGACFEIHCYNSTACHDGKTITVTATNFCPPNYAIPSDAGGWCNPPRRHFDLSQPMFLEIAEYKAGIVPVRYRRVPCVRSGGIKFEMGGNFYWTTIVVYNVGGHGDVKRVAVKTDGSSTYQELMRLWGQLWVWPDHSGHGGQGMSIRVATWNKKVVESPNVVPANWQIGQTFEGKQFE